MNLKRESHPAVRRAQRVLQMVHELHKLGHQRLRIAPGMSSSGLHWRCSVSHIGNILSTHGAKLRNFDCDSAHYTSAQNNEYFDWKDATKDTARQLARKFLERFPEIAQKGQGQDWPYVGWYVQMLGFADRGAFPVAYADWYSEERTEWLPTTEGFQSGLPMPPGGEAEPSRE